MGTDARTHAVSKAVAAMLLAGVALALCAANAHALRATRHYDAICARGTAQERRCTKPFDEEAERGAARFHLSVPKTCRTRSVLAASAADKPKTIRHLAIRLDGETVGTTSLERPYWVGVSIECAALAAGDHVVTATLRRRDGSVQKLTKTLTRLPGPEPDSVFKPLARRHGDGVCDLGTAQERRCSFAVPQPTDPSRLSMPRTCQADASVRVQANAQNPRTLRSLVLRLDGKTIASTPKPYSYWAYEYVDCDDLAVGDHAVTATIRRRTGKVQKLTRTLTRSPAPYQTAR